MYNMCKCCQSCFESIYWHCIEKRFCYDDNIALFEEPKEYQQQEKNNNAFDNMAFYDNVALIANRPIFTIEPLPEQKPKPIIEKQPRATKTIKWWEDIEKQNRENESKQLEVAASSNTITTIQEETGSNLDLDFFKATIHEESEADTVDVATIDCKPSVAKKVEKIEVAPKPPETSCFVEKPKEKSQKPKSNMLDVIPTSNLRRKSLTQRRMSKSLSLIIDPTELPLIRQSSMPKFYLDTPEMNQADSSIAGTPSAALASPVMPSNHSFHFDLKSVVQLEKEKTQSFRSDARLANVRRKIRPLKIKRQTSMINLSPTKSSQL